MYQLILMLHVIVAIVLVALVLMQHGKGADIGASFGSGASNTVFGSQGTGNFLFKLTGSLALVFFITSLSLSFMVSSQNGKTAAPVIPQETQAPSIPVPMDSKK